MEWDIISNYVFLEKQELVQNTIYLYILIFAQGNNRLKDKIIAIKFDIEIQINLIGLRLE